MRAKHLPSGFTVIEMLVVLAAIGLLLSLVTPRYVRQLDIARETALRENLRVTRDAIDKFFADQARYPDSLAELVTQRYLRQLPLDPLTQRIDTWVIVAPSGGKAKGSVADVRSGAEGKSLEGSPYAAW